MTAATPMRAPELLERLRRHYIKPDSNEWNGGVFVAEVGVNGSTAQRRADAIYAGFTSASGRLLVGHEVKVSRADWLAELKEVGKADFWHDNCHQWWLVVGDPMIVHDGELPDGWGLMAPYRNGMRKVSPAVTRKVTPSWTAMRSILSRFDTERVALISRASEVERNAHRNKIEELTAQVRAFSPRIRSVSDIDRLGALIVRSGEEAARLGIYTQPSDDEIVAALVHATVTRSSADTALRQLDRKLSALDGVLEPLTRIRAEIARISASLSEADAALAPAMVG